VAHLAARSGFEVAGRYPGAGDTDEFGVLLRSRRS